eukprot:scaffold20900_cov64-Phaeocystis_antarctica.AAC.9
MGIDGYPRPMPMAHGNGAVFAVLTLALTLTPTLTLTLFPTLTLTLNPNQGPSSRRITSSSWLAMRARCR